MPQHPDLSRRQFLQYSGISASLAALAGPCFSKEPLTENYSALEKAQKRAEHTWNDIKAVLAEHQISSRQGKTLGGNASLFIGEYDTPITSLEGAEGTLQYKLATTDDRWPALLTEEFSKLNLKKGDYVAVGTTGSMPASTFSVLSALKALELKPVIIASVASSSYGANNPDFTILHMLEACSEEGVLPFFPVAASPGGTHDRAANKDIDEKVVRDIISKFETRLLWPEDTFESTHLRLEMFEAEVGGNLSHYKLAVNIGGGGAMCGGGYGFFSVPSGIERSIEWNLEKTPYCVLTYFANALDCPIANIRDLTKIGDGNELKDVKVALKPYMEAKRVKASKKKSYAPMWSDVPKELVSIRG